MRGEGREIGARTGRRVADGSVKGGMRARRAGTGRPRAPQGTQPGGIPARRFAARVRPKSPYGGAGVTSANEPGKTLCPPRAVLFDKGDARPSSSRVALVNFWDDAVEYFKQTLFALAKSSSATAVSAISSEGSSRRKSSLSVNRLLISRPLASAAPQQCRFDGFSGSTKRFAPKRRSRARRPSRARGDPT